MNARSQSTHWEVTWSPPPGADACYSLPLPSLEMFPPFHAVVAEAVASQSVKRGYAEW